MSNAKMKRIREILEDAEDPEELLENLSPMERAIAEEAIEG